LKDKPWEGKRQSLKDQAVLGEKMRNKCIGLIL